MNKILISMAIFAVALARPVTAKASWTAGQSAVLKNSALAPKMADQRIKKLERFLTAQHSPLAQYAPLMVKMADKYQIDWKLVPAISGVESSFGRRIPYHSFNAYGWANGHYHFLSWPNSIGHVTRVLSEKYYNRGLKTPKQIGPVYAPPSKTWAIKVNFWMKKIDSFGRNKFTLTI